MKHLIIIGARGAGRETYITAKETKEYLNKEYEIKGFLDDKIDALDGFIGYPPILSSVEEYNVQSDDVFICALGDPKWRKYYSEIIKVKGGKFINIIHLSVNLGMNVKIGEGCIIKNNSGISCDVKIGDFVFIQGNVALGHDVVIGNYCHLNHGVFMGGYSQLEEFAVMQPYAILLPNKKVGSEAVVGAGSVVIRNVKSRTTVMGIPAKILKF